MDPTITAFPSPTTTEHVTTITEQTTTHDHTTTTDVPTTTTDSPPVTATATEITTTTTTDVPPETTTTTGVPSKTTTTAITVPSETTTTTTDSPVTPTTTTTSVITSDSPTTRSTKSSTSGPFTTTSNSDPHIPSTVTSITTTNSNTAVPPLIPSQKQHHSGLSGGAIAGIAIGGVVVVAAVIALIAMIMIKRKRRLKIDKTLDNLFNPVNLNMQENRHHHPRNDFPLSSAGSPPLRNSDHFNNITDLDTSDHLNSVVLGAGAAGAAGIANAHENMYPYEGNNQQYFQDVNGNRLSYMLPSDPIYDHYNDGAYGHYDFEFMTPQQQQEHEAAYYQEQLYQQHLQHEMDLHAPVTYYDPRQRSDAYYAEHTYADNGVIGHDDLYEFPNPEYHQGPEEVIEGPIDFPVHPLADFTLSQDVGEESIASSTVGAPRPDSEIETVAQTVVGDGDRVEEGDKETEDSNNNNNNNSKSEPWPDNRNSIASSSSMTNANSPKRNPQLLAKVADESK
ncbi:hypothetical protein BGZ49_001101 [Haplosporangium sp. Z 27]|nr:hypothetical protein BGZ49_001101 [Haplosporangium sp. Z 27]